MEVDKNRETRQHVHELVDLVSPAQLATVEDLLESMLDDEPMTEEDIARIRESRDYFAGGGQGIPFEQVVAECGFTMEEVLRVK